MACCHTYSAVLTVVISEWTPERQKVFSHNRSEHFYVSLHFTIFFEAKFFRDLVVYKDGATGQKVKDVRLFPKA